MNVARTRPTVVVDRYTRCCLTIIAVLLTVLIVALWADGPVSPAVSGAAPAPEAQQSGIGNPAAQRMAVVKAINSTNAKLERIIGLLTSGKIKVTVAEPEEKHVPVAVPKAARPKR